MSDDPKEKIRRLLIKKGSSHDRRVYTFELTNPHCHLGSVRLEMDSAEYFEEFYRTVESLPKRERSPNGVLLELADMCADLAEEILSERLGEELAELAARDDLVALEIRSAEAWIPWEVVRLPRYKRGPRRFLCEAFDVSRWVEGESPQTELPIRRMAVVVPQDAGLPRAGDELKFLKTTLREKGCEVDEVRPEKGAVRDALSANSYDCWHFIGHGKQSRAELRLGPYTQIAPRNLLGDDVQIGQGRPLVFLNGCHTGVASKSLTGASGWAESFLAAGAGAFLGAFWAIDDEAASDFTKAFYTHFLSGMPIAEAVRNARLEIKKANSNDSTWLAYSLYAHPLARSCAAR